MKNDEPKTRKDLLPGTLEMLILKTLVRGPMHGYAITKSLRQTSEDVLRVDEGSLYPALQRLEVKAWVTAEWRISEKNRRARVYELTADGRAQLQAEIDRFDRMVRAITLVLQTT
jgi:PadR family transcriptional regulator PadR